jgi:hypothetical protein
MVYAKPEVNLIGTATAAVRGNPVGSKIGVNFDSQSTQQNSLRVTAAAYEADE